MHVAFRKRINGEKIAAALVALNDRRDGRMIVIPAVAFYRKQAAVIGGLPPIIVQRSLRIHASPINLGAGRGAGNDEAGHAERGLRAGAR